MRRDLTVPACLLAAAFAARPGLLRAQAPSEPPDPGLLHIARPKLPETAGDAFRLFSSTAPGCVNAFGNPVTCNPATMLKIQYFGGKVIPNAKVYAVFWGAGVDATTQADIGPFYTGVTNSGWMDWLTEYSTLGIAGGSNQAIGRGAFGRAVTITPAVTGHACVKNSIGVVPMGVTCIWDTDIPAELDAQITAGHLPFPDQHTIYMVHFPPTFDIQSADRVNIADSCVQYCAYHGTYTRSGYGSVYFAVLPDLGANGCQAGCGAGSTFQNLCSTASHELGEAMTDAEVGLATSLAPPLGWYDGGSVSQGEIGDMCNQSTGSVVSLADGFTYTVQNLFSKVIWDANPVPSTLACVSSRFDANDYDVFFNPNSASVAAGGSVSLPIHLETTHGSASAVALAVSPLSVLPSGVNAAPTLVSVSSVAPGNPAVANLSISVDPGTPAAADRIVVLNATAGSLVHSAAILVQVTAGTTNDWSLSLAPSGRNVFPGGTAAYTVSGAVISGTSETVSLSTANVTGLPPGVTATSFVPASLTPGSTTSTLTLTASAGAAASSPTTFSVKGTSASQAAGHTAMSQVTVDGLPTVSFAAPTNGSTVSGTVTIALNETAGANTTLASTVIKIDGVVYSGPLAWNTTAYSNGLHTLDATATDADGGTANAPQITVTLNNPVNDWSLSLAPSGRNVFPGGTASYTVSGAVISGTSEPVSLSTANVTGLPPGVTATSFVPASLTPGSTTSTLTLTASAGAAASSPTTFSVKGTSASQAAGHTAMSQVTVDGLPTVSFTAPTNGSTVSGTVTIALNETAGANTTLASTVIKIDGVVYSGPLAWNTTTYSSGPHTLDATAADADGGTANAPQITVTVNNAFRLLTLTPCRIFDTRVAPGPALAAGETRSIPIAGICGVPSTAKAIVVNLTVTNEGGTGNVVAWASGDPPPGTRFVSFRPGVARANTGIVRLSAGGAIAVLNQSAAPADVIFDISGYFE